MRLVQDLATLNEEQLTQLYSKLTEETAQGVLVALQQELLQRCAEDGLFWLRFVVTRDEADPSQSVKRFPIDLEYIPAVWRAIDESNKVVIAKSRQMMASWLLCAYCCWWARFKSNQAIFWQARKDDDANSMVALPGTTLGRMQFIEMNMPSFLRQNMRFSEGRMGYPNGSFIQSLAGGADQIRGRVFSVLVEDEYAFQEEQNGVYTAVAPLIQKGAKAIFVSTPNGATNQFSRLYHGGMDV